MDCSIENIQKDFPHSLSSPTKQKAKIIQAIKKNDVHQICSGQVVLNLATAVKELVENSLDAGATCIEVRLKEYGRESVKVIDNGCGVGEANFQGLTMKHHTSKLQDFSDLVSVSTFGFRGEALSSLCAMSCLTVETRHADATSGTRLVFDQDGNIVSRAACPRQVGTSVCITNLFSSLPVRQKEFHRNLKREFGKMTQLLYAYCLVATGVKITCVNQAGKAANTTVAATHGSKSVRENIGSVFGSKQAQALLDVAQDDRDSRFTIEGYVSSANHGLGRSAPDRQFYYVNSRPCEPSKLMKAVNETYHAFNANQHPFVFLNVTVERSDVDVNVTPDKRQVFFDNEKQLLAVVKASITKLYEDNLSTFQFQNTSLRLQTSLPPPAASPSPSPAPKESKLAAMLSEWKRQSSTSTSPSQGVKRTMEEESDNSPGKQPCILNFFKRQSTHAGVKASSSNLDKDNCDRLSLSTHRTDKPITVDDDCVSSSDAVETNSVPFSESCKMDADSSAVDASVELNTTTYVQRPTMPTVTCSDTADGSSDMEVIKVEESTIVNVSLKNQKDELETGRVKEYSSIDNELCDSGNIVSEEDNNATAVSNSLVIESCEMDDSVGGALSVHHGVRSDSADVVTERDGERNTSEAVTAYNGVRAADMVTDRTDERVTERENEAVTICDGVRAAGVEVEEERPTGFKRRSVWMAFTLDLIVEKLNGRKAKKDAADTVVRFRAAIEPGKNKSAEQELGREIKKHMFKEMRIVGQFNLGFIITRLGSDLFIIDQHASDEKYNFETLQLTQSLMNQRLVCPIALELCAVSENTLVQNIHIFKTNGFDFLIDHTAEPMKRVKLTGIPMSKNWQFGKEDVDELLFMLQDSPGTMCRPSRVRAMFASRACRKSVMIGSALSQSDMRRLVDNMGTIEQPWNCPHGRPTMRHLINLDLLHSRD